MPQTQRSGGNTIPGPLFRRAFLGTNSLPFFFNVFRQHRKYRGMRGAKRGRSFTTKRPKAKKRRVSTTSGAMVTQARVFIPRSYGNPMAYSETKYFDKELAAKAVQSVAGTSWADTECDPATTNCLFAPTQGNDFNNREGRKCWVKSIKLRGTVLFASGVNLSVASPAQKIRMILYMDKQTNGAQAQGEDVIDSGVTATEPVIDEFQNPKNFGRFRVLWDRVYLKRPTSTSYDGTNLETGADYRSFKVFKKFKKPILVHFNATNGGTISDITDNSFHLIVGKVDGNSVVTLNYKSRVSFCE